MNNKKEVVVDVIGISKKFHVLNSNNSENKDEADFFALKNISFALYKGDVLGIIGKNGSGKTTLLKILSQITKPTSGEAHFYGKATSILDIGNNLHPDFTGRENVAVHLKLANINPVEYESIYCKVKQFSELEKFFEKPVRFYSNGMFLRLAFSIAFHIPSDILILDEVLSVGDEGFRIKCRDLIKTITSQGKTIIFVSHNQFEILDLSNKCMWLDKGRIRKIGFPTEVVGEYFAFHHDNADGKKNIINTETNTISNQQAENGGIDLTWNEENAPGNDILAIHHLSVRAISSDKLYHSSPIELKFCINKKKERIQIGAFFFIQDAFYQPVLVGHFLNNSEGYNFSDHLKNETGLIEIKSIIPPNFLIPGKYYLLVRFGMEENNWSDTSEEAFRFSEKLSFTIYAEPGYKDFVGDVSKGSVRPKLDWQIKNRNRT